MQGRPITAPLIAAIMSPISGSQTRRLTNRGSLNDYFLIRLASQGQARASWHLRIVVKHRNDIRLSLLLLVRTYILQHTTHHLTPPPPPWETSAPVPQINQITPSPTRVNLWLLPPPPSTIIITKPRRPAPRYRQNTGRALELQGGR